MLCARLILLVGVVFLVKAASSSYTFDGGLTIDDFEEHPLDNLGEASVSELSRERRDADEEVSSPSPLSDPLSKREPRRCPPCPSRQRDSHHPPCPNPTKGACARPTKPLPYTGPPCELRPMFHQTMQYDLKTRQGCFDRWEKPALEAKGVNFSKPHNHRGIASKYLIINKGCDVQCMFLDLGLLVEEGESVKVSKEGIMGLLKENDDPQEIIDIFGQQIDKCIEESAELVHPKQSCKSGADEFLPCIRLKIDSSCAGAKWKGNKSCEELEDADGKLKDCFQEEVHKVASQMYRSIKQKYLHNKYELESPSQ